MVRLYSDEEMDEKCKDYRPVPLKLYRVVYGLEGRGTNPLTTTRSDRMLALPSANVNLATKTNIRLNRVPASVIKKRYNSLYQDVIVEGKNINIEPDIEGEYMEERAKRVRRTKAQMAEAGRMGEEDFDADEAEAGRMGEEDFDAEEVISVFIDPVTGITEELRTELEPGETEETEEPVETAQP